jgi:hypothetical protein
MHANNVVSGLAIVLRPKPGPDGHYRFPREDDLAVHVKNAIDMLKRPTPVRINLGREFLIIKKRVRDRGERWTRYFAVTFTGPFDITLRTAQNYMDLAKKEDSHRNERVSFLQPGTHELAQKTKQNTEATEAEARVAPRIFKLPLRVNPDQEKLFSKLSKSNDWPSKQQQIITLLEQMCTTKEPEVREEESPAVSVEYETVGA